MERVSQRTAVEALGLVTVSQVCAQLNICWNTLRAREALRLVPGPSVVFGRRLYYSQNDLAATQEYFAKNRNHIRSRDSLGLITVTEMASQLDLSISKLKKAISKGYVDPPYIAVGCRQYYKNDDVQRIKDQYKKMPAAIPHCPPKPEGYLSGVEVAKAMGIPRCTWSNWRASKGLPGPTHQVGRRMFYTTDDVEKIKKYMTDAGYKPCPEKRPRRLDLRKG